MLIAHPFDGCPYLNLDRFGYGLVKFILSIGFFKNAAWQLTTSDEDEVSGLKGWEVTQDVPQQMYCDKRAPI
jgi:hypothetical protein